MAPLGPRAARWVGLDWLQLSPGRSQAPGTHSGARHATLAIAVTAFGQRSSAVWTAMDRVRASRSVILWIGKYNAEDLYLTPRVSSASTQRRIAELHPMVSGAGSPLPGAVLLKPWPLLSNFVRCAFEYLHSLSRACAGWRGCSKGAGRRTIAIGRSHLCTSYHQSRAQPCGKGRTPHGLPGRARLAAFAWPMLLQCHTAAARLALHILCAACCLAASFASSDPSRGASRRQGMPWAPPGLAALLAPGVLEARLRVAQQPRPYAWP